MTRDDEAVLDWLVKRAIASGTHPDVLQVYSGGSKPASYLRITIPDGESTREKSKKTNQNRRAQISRFLELTSGGDLPGALANYGRSGKAKSAGFVAECKKKLNLDSLKVALGLSCNKTAELSRRLKKANAPIEVAFKKTQEEEEKKTRRDAMATKDEETPQKSGYNMPLTYSRACCITDMMANRSQIMFSDGNYVQCGSRETDLPFGCVVCVYYCILRDVLND